MWVQIMHLALCNRCRWNYHLWDETGRTKILQKYWETKSLIRKLLMASTVDPNLRYLARQNYVFSWTRKSGYFNLPYNTIPTSIEKVDSRMRWLISLSHFLSFNDFLDLLSLFDTLVFSTAYSEPFKWIQLLRELFRLKIWDQTLIIRGGKSLITLTSYVLANKNRGFWNS